MIRIAPLKREASSGISCTYAAHQGVHAAARAHSGKNLALQGTLLRTALAFGWDTLFLLPGCCDPFNEKVNPPPPPRPTRHGPQRERGGWSWCSSGAEL